MATVTNSSRAEALAALAALGVKTTEDTPAPKVERTGDEVEAGGDVARLLIKPAHLTYREGDELRYPEAKVGDVVLVSAKQAKRLDALGVTIEPDASDEDLEAAAEGEVTDEQLATMSAADLIAYVGQHPDERGRVNALELERDNPRVTVLKATEVDEDEEDPTAQTGDGTDGTDDGSTDEDEA